MVCDNGSGNAGCGLADFDFWGESACGYFPRRLSLLECYQLCPEGTPSAVQRRCFDAALEHGFQWDGAWLYRTNCQGCSQCIPIRIDVSHFSFSKSQRRLLRKNADISTVMRRGRTRLSSLEKVKLLSLYERRHRTEEEDLSVMTRVLEGMNGLWDGWGGRAFSEKCFAGTRNLDYYIDGSLAGVSVLQFGKNAVYSQYFYYDTSPQVMRRSLGTFSILNEIAYCQKHKIRYYYLGYFVTDCQKMAYKANFVPYQLLQEGKWLEYNEKMGYSMGVRN